ncbi:MULTISPECIES: PhzF family phenazine biosynthesis protein [unclassified Bartonella]|uniref:PhzF family phenazine biosynthesis protein n=1 Tax=unclassified Bartonella TaxID=2645622 RepID=UPI0015FA2A7C|nr:MULTISPECIES: PhzF family phenazine biosynthesis protein [unclassified Bartonella]UXN05454.1 PhzF family phenazine biosynthesis protein [Bartonella sp. HY761]
MKNTHRYEIFDVFTNAAFTGNPLAIVYDAQDLNDEQMLKITQEFNLAETVFVLPAENPIHRAKIRIFKPSGEMPFAGHPTIGAASALANLSTSQQTETLMILEEKIGIVRCAVKLCGDTSFVEFDLPKLPQSLPLTLKSEVFAVAFGVENREIGFENHRPSLWSAGVPFYFVPIDHLSTIAGISADPLFIAQNFADEEGNIPSFYLYCRETQRIDTAFHARMLRADGSEDSATGSAASAFIGLAHHFDQYQNGDHELWLEQGLEMGRPSRIKLGFHIHDDKIANARIGGKSVKIAQGEIFF